MAAKTQFILEGDEARAVQAILRVVDAQKKVEHGARSITRESSKSGKALEGIARAGVSFMAGFASMGTVLQGLRAIVRELERAAALRKEMHGVALTTEQLSLKIAHLRRDVSQAGLAAVTQDIAEIAKQAAISMQTAGSALFFAESAMGAGMPRARAAATAIGRFAAPAGLTPEEVRLVPKIFDITQAYTPGQQMRILNQLRAATAASIAETGEFIEPFITPMTAALQQGFTFPQALAQMVAAIQTTGTVETAATAAKGAVLISGGKTKKAIEYFQAEARKRGIDYGRMTAPERFAFTARLFQESQAAGPGAMDVFKTQVGGKGFIYLQQMFGEAGQRKYAEVLPAIEAAAESDYVQQMAEQYRTTLGAETTALETMGTMTGWRMGRKYKAGAVLDEMTAAALKAAHAAPGGWGGLIKLAAMPERLEKRTMARTILRENLLLAMERAGERTSEWAELQNLYRQSFGAKPLTLMPEYLQDVYERTRGFGLVEEEGRFAGPETVRPVYREMGLPLSGREGVFRRGLEEYYGGGEAIAEQKIQTELLGRIASAVESRMVTMPRIQD